MRALNELGVKIAIDDFGTGHSSLGYLKRFPIDTVKIDSSFLADIVTDSVDRSLVNGIIAMSHSMDLRVVAEGVEQADQVAMLRQMSCDELQGFVFSRPVPPERAREMLVSDVRLEVPPAEDAQLPAAPARTARPGAAELAAAGAAASSQGR